LITWKFFSLIRSGIYAIIEKSENFGIPPVVSSLLLDQEMKGKYGNYL
jgi:hypothetical protein